MNEPGVSGKDKNGKEWVNSEKLEDQEDFIKGSKDIGRSDNLFGRSDLENQKLANKDEKDSLTLSQEHVIEALERSPGIDVSELLVTLYGSKVTLDGYAANPNEIRAIENVVKNLPGVSDVITHITPREGDAKNRN